MNVEGDFRYVDSGAFEECAGFLDYLDSYGYEWEEAFLGWVAASEKWRRDQKTSQNYWDSWNLVKVAIFFDRNNALLLWKVLSTKKKNFGKYYCLMTSILKTSDQGIFE